jgi:hypothetical protein
LCHTVLNEILAGNLPAACLLAFIRFDPHPRLVCRAARNYLQYHIREVEKEFAGVDDLVRIMTDDETANRGAVLAGLVSMGDRRINAVVRAARRPLSGSDIKSFSRVSLPELSASSVEFCLDWLIELSQNYCKEHVDDIALMLMLLADQDQRGVIEESLDLEFEAEGSRKTRNIQVRNFEDYFSEIRPVLDYLHRCDGFELIIGKVIEVWETHSAEAQALRMK